MQDAKIQASVTLVFDSWVSSMYISQHECVYDSMNNKIIFVSNGFHVDQGNKVCCPRFAFTRVSWWGVFFSRILLSVC